MRTSDDFLRVLAMLPWLAGRPGISVESAAHQWGVHPDQLNEELRRIASIGADPDAIASGHWDYLIDMDFEDRERISIQASEYVARPLRLNHLEVLGLLAGLHAIAAVSDQEHRDQIQQLVGRLEALGQAGENGSSDIEVQVESGDGDVREHLAGALAGRRRTRLVYDGITRGHTTYPLVDPARLVVHDGALYLQGFDVEQQAWRHYRVDRIAEVEVLDQASAHHGEPPEVQQGWRADRGVRVHLGPQAAYVLEYDPVDQVQEHPDGSATATLHLASQDFLVKRLLQLGAAARVLDDAQVAERVRTVAAATLECYGSAPDTLADEHET